MDRVYNARQKPFNQIQGAGVAIRELRSQQRHLGVLYRDSESKEVLLLHLWWHSDLRCEPPKEKYLWIDPAIPPRRLTQVAAVCRKVWRANGKNTIPYGFCQPSDCFDATTGVYLFGPTHYGLTCATFVLAVFQHAGLSLVQYGTWPVNRPGDAEWQESIVDELRKSPEATPEHIQAVQSDIGTVRYRPEEVAGAATVTPSPAHFQIAEERGRQILVRLRKLRPSTWKRIILRSLGYPFCVLWNWVRKNILRR